MLVSLLLIPRDCFSPPHTMHTPTSTQTHHLSADDVVAIVRTLGVSECLRGVAEAIRADYLRWLGLPTVMAFGVLADVATGVPVLLSELTLTTAIRTAAMSVVAARVLARADAACMALIGNGAQSEFQALAFHHLLGIGEIRVFDTDPAATRKLMGNLEHTGLRVVACKSTKDAVRGADIVTTVTADKTNATIITPGMLEPGMHMSGLGGDCPGKTELHPDVLRAARVSVEYDPQTRVEGDLQHLKAALQVNEIWKVLQCQAQGRVERQDATIFDSVGFAIEDYTAFRYFHACERKLGAGQAITLIPALVNTKNLFGSIHSTAEAQVA